MSESKILLFFEGLEPEESHTIGEIVKRAIADGRMEKAYPEDPEGPRKARSAIVTYFNREKIEPNGKRKVKGRKVNTFLGKDLLKELPVELVQVVVKQDLKRRLHFTFGYAALTTLLLLAIIFFPKGDPVLKHINHLKETRNMAGLRELNRETSQARESISQENKEEVLASIPLQGWTFDTSEYRVYPYSVEIAESIADLDNSVVVFDSMVAVFPGLDLWVVADENGDYRPVLLGTRIAHEGFHGLVTAVRQERLTYRTENGESRYLVRPPLRLPIRETDLGKIREIWEVRQEIVTGDVYDRSVPCYHYR